MFMNTLVSVSLIAPLSLEILSIDDFEEPSQLFRSRVLITIEGVGVITIPSSFLDLFLLLANASPTPGNKIFLLPRAGVGVC